MSKLRKIILGSISFVILAVFTVGIITSSEILYRTFGFQANRGELISAKLFPFEQYVVSTHPKNLALGNSDSILEGYFGHGDCDADNNVTAKFNSLGYRSPEFPLVGSKKPNEIRLIVTGGSASISWNIGEKCTLDSLLKTAVQDAFPDHEVTVFNLGSGAWKSFQELLAVQLHGVELQPDLVVHFSGFNDAFHAYSMPINNSYTNGMIQLSYNRYVDWVSGSVGAFLSNYRVGTAVKSLLSKAPVILDRPTGTSPDAPELAAAAVIGKLATKLHYPLKLDEIAERQDFDPFNQQNVDNYIKNERLMAASLKTVGAQLMSVLQPTLYLKDPLSEKEIEMIHSGYAPTVNFTVQGYLRLRSELNELASTEDNVTYVDMSTAFNGDNTSRFADNVHFYHGGYRIVTDKLAPKVIKLLQTNIK